MKITRTSLVTGIVHTLDLNVTQAQLDAYEQGMLLQDAFPDLPAPEREFIKTGITPEEWIEHVLKAEEALNQEEEPDEENASKKADLVDGILSKMGGMHSHYDVVEREGGFALVQTFEISDDCLSDYGMSSHEQQHFWAETREQVQDYIINLKK